MKNYRYLLLAGLVSCSSHITKPTPSLTTTRTVASMDAFTAELPEVNGKIEKLTTNIFRSYLMGQLLLADFDKKLDKNAEGIMQTETYSDLLAVRVHVDSFEEEINQMYLHLVMVSALPKYSLEQKKMANESLKTIGQFMDGLRTNHSELPDNLKPMVLGNLMNKQTELFEDLKDLHDDSSVTGDNSEAKKTIHENMVLLRATRLAFHKDLSNYQVDQDVLKAAVDQELKGKDYKALQKDIKKMSKEIKKYMSDLKVGRSTSSDVIFSSATASGNITGNGFPANTWSLTYDDGPGKGTNEILANLKARNQKATFFMLAKQVEGLPTTAMNVKNAEMDIASHSYTHAQLTKVGPATLEKEVGTAKGVIEKKLGVVVKLFRLPYGAGVSVSNIRNKIAEHKMIHVFWNVDTLDWQDKNPQSVFARTVKQMKASSKNAGVVLFHDIHPTTVTASTLLMDHFAKNKVNVCTVQGVVDQINKNLPSCQ